MLVIECQSQIFVGYHCPKKNISNLKMKPAAKINFITIYQNYCLYDTNKTVIFIITEAKEEDYIYC